MLSNKVKASFLAFGAIVSFSALADTGFKVPVHYNIELVDGESDPDSYSRFSRTISLAPGKHQVVLTFKDSFKNGSDSRIVQSIDPVVIDIEDLKADQVITFQYKKPANEEQAKRYAHQQKITLTDNTGRTLPASEAKYFILTSDRGFSLMRDYKQELGSINRLYAPAYAGNGSAGIQMTEYGAPTIRAGAETNSSSAEAVQGLTLEPMGADSSAMTTSSTAKGSKADAATYNSLVKMYNSADDATKLKFVKYVMSH
ncbi:MAG: DUF2057 family protein [Succinivibrio sp.]